MPIKDIVRRRQYRREWYSKNKESEKKHVIRRKKEILIWFENHKKTLRCGLCGESHPAVLDFHHKEGDSKEFGINILVHHGYSIDKIKKELEKCQALCANCHRKVHYKIKNSNI